MTTEQLHAHRLALAIKRKDVAAIAILEGGRRFVADPAPLRDVYKALTPLRVAA